MNSLGFIQKDIPIETEHQVKELVMHGISNLYIESEYYSKSEEFTKLLEEAEPSDCIIVYSLSSIWHLKNLLQYFIVLKEKKIRLIAINEDIDTERDTEFYENIILSLELDTVMKSLRIKRAISNRMNQGQTMGRPSINEDLKIEIRELRTRKYSVREIAAKCNVSVGTAHKYANIKL